MNFFALLCNVSSLTRSLGRPTSSPTSGARPPTRSRHSSTSTATLAVRAPTLTPRHAKHSNILLCAAPDLSYRLPNVKQLVATVGVNVLIVSYRGCVLLPSSPPPLVSSLAPRLVSPLRSRAATASPRAHPLKKACGWMQRYVVQASRPCISCRGVTRANETLLYSLMRAGGVGLLVLRRRGYRPQESRSLWPLPRRRRCSSLGGRPSRQGALEQLTVPPSVQGHSVNFFFFWCLPMTGGCRGRREHVHVHSRHDRRRTLSSTPSVAAVLAV